MCLLIFKPAGHVVPVEYLQRAARVHPHGFGIAHPQGAGQPMRLWRSVDRPLDWVREARKLRDVPAVLHARWATHGPKTKANCHPTWLNDDRTLVVGHNGMLRSLPDCKQGRSDTRVFADHVLRWFDGKWYNDPILVEQLGSLIGTSNKMVVMDADGEYAIINPRSGEWNDGIWYSNDSYLPVSQHLQKTRTKVKGFMRGLYDAYADDDYDFSNVGTSYARDNSCSRSSGCDRATPAAYVYGKDSALLCAECVQSGEVKSFIDHKNLTPLSAEDLAGTPDEYGFCDFCGKFVVPETSAA